MRCGSCLLIPAVLLAASPAAAQLAQGERDRAMSHLHASRKAFLDAVEGLTDAQWSFKPDARTWSVAECAEHIALSEDLLFDLVSQQMMKTAPEPEKKKLAAGRDEEVLKIITDRSARAEAPKALAPSGRWPSRDALVEHFKKSRARTIQYVQTTSDDLRSRFREHPAAKLLDAYQWLLLTAAHTERHTAQIAEVKANPRFPR